MKLISLFLIMLMPAFASAQNLALQVISKQPAGQLDNYVDARDITVSFNQPVVALGETSQHDGDNCPLKILPNIKGSCRWLGTQTLVFTPDNGFNKATRYTMYIEKGFKSEVSGAALEKREEWFFDTARPQVLSSLPYNNEAWLSLRPQISLAFNMPVSRDVLKTYTVFKEGKTTNVPFKISPISDELFEKDYKYTSYKKDSIYVIEPTRNLKPGNNYTITVKEGLRALKGNLASKREKVINFSTYNVFNMAAAPEKKCLPFDPSLSFTNPVTAGEIYKNISFEPEVKFNLKNEDDSGYASSIKVGKESRRVYNVSLRGLELEPGQQYRVKLKAGTTDIFGNKLGRDINFIWENDGYCPAITFKGGFGVLESEQHAYHPVTAVNAGKIEVEKVRIDYKDFIPFYKEGDSYCKKRSLTGDVIKTVWEPNLGTVNEPISTFFDLIPALGDKKAGIVFLQFLNPFRSTYNNKGCWQNSIDNITNIGLTIKTSPQDILVWATYFDDAKPAKGKKVELRDYKNNIVWTGKTDKHGVAKAPGWSKLNFEQQYSWRAPEVWAFVHDKDNVAIIANSWNQGIEPWRFNINYDYNPPKQDLRTFIFTERDIYRQGEEVYIKGIMRSLKDGLFNYSGLKKVTLSISDPTGKEVLNREVAVDNYSAFDYKYNVSINAPSGNWSIRVSADKDNFYYSSFRVEAMKPAEFKVNLVALSDLYLSSQEAVFTLNANYMFGAPMDNAELRWNAKLAPATYAPEGYDEYSFAPCWMRSESKTETLLNANTKLDDAGSASLRLDLPVVTVPSNLYLEAGVLSPQNQELFTRKTVTVLPADLLIGVKQKQSMIQVGETVSTEIVTVDIDGKKVNKALKATLVRREYLSVKKAGVSGRLEWVSEEKNIPVATASFNTLEGKAKWDYVADKAGYYFLTISGKDSKGNETTAGLNFYVSSDEEVYWQQKDDDILEIAAERPSYKVGEKAKLLIKSPYEQGQALITIERQGILETFTEPVKGGAVLINIPIKEEYLPNVFISAILVQGRTDNPSLLQGEDLAKPQAKFGYTSVKVSSENRYLTTKITTDKPKYQPGETVKADIQVNNNKGKGLVSSVTFFAVDEGALALTAFKTPDIFNFFYNTEPLGVSTADNRLYLIGQRSFGQKGENRGGGGADDSKLGGIDLRSNFKFTPFYTATVMTDKKGKASVSFQLPDNLTKFRLMAVAASERDFGSGEQAIEVAKPVMIKPVLPRFARLNDTFNCGFTVYNYTDQDNLTLSLSQTLTGGIRFNEGGAVAVTLKAGASKNIMGSCTVYKLEDATFKFTASSTKGSDGLQVKLPVVSLEQKQVLSESSSTEDKEKQNLVKPKNLLSSANNSVNIAFASSALLDLSGAVNYLLAYPHNCLEQQLSRVLPILTGMDMIVAFNLGDKAVLEAKAKEILATLASYQKPDGGFAYWPDSYRADPYITAYTLDIISRAKGKEYKVTDDETIKKAVDYLNKYLSEKKTTSPYSSFESTTTRAYAIYALALNNVNVSGHFNNLMSSANLTPEAKVYLLKAAKSLGMSSAVSKLRTELLNYAKQSNSTLHFEASGSSSYFFSSDTMLTALIMEAMLSTGNGFANDSKAVTWLMSQKNKQGNWGNTFVNAAVFNAVSTYFNIKEQKAPNFSASLRLDGKKLFDAVFIGHSLEQKAASFTFDQIFNKYETAPTEIVKTGDGRLYYNLSMNYYPETFKDNISAGFKVEKNIRPLYPNLGELAAGHRAVIDITITTTQNRTFVVLEDFLPAGFEIIDTSLATESSNDAGSVYDYNQRQYFNRVERYDDRLAAFADYLPKGTYKFSYIVQAVAAGKYGLPSTWVSQMYYPEVMGRTASGNLVIK